MGHFTHILLWLDDIADVELSHFSATIQWGNKEEAFSVYDLQKSRTSILPVRQGPNESCKTVERHTSRACIPALTGSLQCSMDVQSSDGKGMLLKYVTSCVAKCHDVVKTQQLYSRVGSVPSSQSFLKNMHPWNPKWYCS